MEIEYEATFVNIDKDEIRDRLRKIGAQLIKPEFLQKRFNFHLPKDKKNNYSWVRVRDEGDKITLSLKSFKGDSIEDQKELCLKIDNFNSALELLERFGCEEKNYQETKRELWMLDGVEICIDEWPHLESFVEIEGKSEKEVISMSKRLEFDYLNAVFGGVDELYSKKYGVHVDVVNAIRELTFESENPFLKQ